MTSTVCPRCTTELKRLSFLSGHIKRCEVCEGVLLDRSVTATLFDGLTCRLEPPGPDTLRCAECRVAMTRVQFAEGTPLHACGAHGIWLDRGDRSQLEPSIARKLRRRETRPTLPEILDSLVEVAQEFEYHDVSAHPSRGEEHGGSSCGSSDASCGGCGGGGD